MDQTDFDDLRKAKHILENPGIAAKVAHVMGMPIEKGYKLLPEHWHAKVNGITLTALMKASHVAVLTMKDIPGRKASNMGHKIAAVASGGLGGFFGLSAMALELPISMTIMLRSIADIARSEGEVITEIEARLSCIEVLALGGPQSRDKHSDSGYFATRMALAKSMAEAAEYITQRGFIEKGAPALVRLIINIAERFSIQVTEKAAAQAIPAIGAAGGALVNTLFMDHFQDMAQGHFMVRRIERKYGKEAVKVAYDSIRP